MENGNGNNGYGQFNRWFRSEVIAAFAVGSAVAAAITFFMSPINTLNTQVAVINTQISNIKNNDLTHIYQTETGTATQLQTIESQNIQILQELAAVNAILKISGK